MKQVNGKNKRSITSYHDISWAIATAAAYRRDVGYNTEKPSGNQIILNIMKQILMIFSLFLVISCGNSNYEILKEDVIMSVSRIDVKLNGKADKSELERISNEIRASRKSYDKV